MAKHFITALYGGGVKTAVTKRRLQRTMARATGLFLKDNVLFSEPTAENALRTVIEAEGLDNVGSLLPLSGLDGYLVGNPFLDEEVQRIVLRKLQHLTVVSALANALHHESMPFFPIKVSTEEGYMPLVVKHYLFYTNQEVFSEYIIDRLRGDGTGKGYVLEDAREIV